MVKIICLSMFGMVHGQNRAFRHGWNLSWSKSSVSAWLECVMVKLICLSMFGMVHGQNRLFQHVCTVSWSK
jgi:hypothetical protein